MALGQPGQFRSSGSMKMSMSSKLAGVQGNKDLGRVGGFQNCASAQPIHLLFDLRGCGVGQVAGCSNERCDCQKGYRQFQANPHN